MKQLITIVFGLAILTFPVGALADEPLEPITGLGTGYQTETAIENPLTTTETLLTNVVGVLTLVGGMMFLIYIILAGLTWITAREEAERISKAKQVFMNALIGLAIVVAAWSIAGILQTIFGFNLLSPTQYLDKISPGGGGPDVGDGLKFPAIPL